MRVGEGGGGSEGEGGRISSNTRELAVRQSMELRSNAKPTTAVATTVADYAADVESQGPTDYNNNTTSSSFMQLYPSCMKPTTAWSIYQILWVFIQSIFGSAVVFGINFGFTLLATKGKEVTLFDFPIPMVGAFFIVILFTTLGGWFVSGSLMSLDSLQGRVTPIDPKVLGKLWSHRGSSWWWKHLQISEFVAPALSEMSVNLISNNNSSYNNSNNNGNNSNNNGNDSSNNESDRSNNNCESSSLCASTESPWSIQKLIRRTLDNIIIAMPWIVIILLTLFPILIIISFAVFGNHGMRNFGNSQPAFMAAFTGLFANIIFQPICAIMSLANVGERYLQNSGAI